MEFAQENQTESSEKRDKENIDHYVQAKQTINNEESVFSWYRKRTIAQQKLSILAKSLIIILANSCTSERIFSLTGRIFEEKRQNSSDDIFDDVLFI